MARSTVPFGQRLTVSPGEAAGLLGVSETFIRQQITAGALPATRWGRRWLVPRTAIEAFGRGVQAVPPETGRPSGRRTG